MAQMTKEFRDVNCYCDNLSEDRNTDCDICEEFIDQRIEDHEIRKRKRIFEEQEY